MRLSKREALAEAVRIAERFVGSHGAAGWTCLGAKPDMLAPAYRHRKDIIQWSVVFEVSGFVGGSVVLVGIETGEAQFH